MNNSDVQSAFREPVWTWLQLAIAFLGIILWLGLGAQVFENGRSWWPLVIFAGFLLMSVISAVKAIRRLRHQHKQR